MKKILYFIVDVLLIMIAFTVTDVIVLKYQIESFVIEFLIFVGISLILEAFKWIITRIFYRE